VQRNLHRAVAPDLCANRGRVARLGRTLVRDAVLVGLPPDAFRHLFGDFRQERREAVRIADVLEAPAAQLRQLEADVDLAAARRAARAHGDRHVRRDAVVEDRRLQLQVDDDFVGQQPLNAAPRWAESASPAMTAAIRRHRRISPPERCASLDSRSGYLVLPYTRGFVIGIVT